MVRAEARPPARPRAPARWGTGRRPGGPPPRKEGFGRAGGLSAAQLLFLAISSTPEAVGDACLSAVSWTPPLEWCGEGAHGVPSFCEVKGTKWRQQRKTWSSWRARRRREL